jgi:preprotein translocase subunit SecE
MADRLKIVVAIACAMAGLAGFYYLEQSPMIVRVAALLAGAAAGATAFLTSQPGRQFHAYAQESVAETRKVVWPTRKETVQTTGVVFAFVVAMALFLWLVDAVLVWVVKLLLGQGE